MLNSWLIEYKKIQGGNPAILIELLEVLHKLPVTIITLKNVSLFNMPVSKSEVHSLLSFMWVTV